MKLGIFIIVLVSSVAAFAAENVNSSRDSLKRQGSSQDGIYVGLDYMNVTDLHRDGEIKAFGRTYPVSQQGGMHLGAAGITLGYNHTAERGIGFSAGVRMLESFNKSETGEQKIQMIIPEANLNLALSRYFLVYAGVNASVWTGFPDADRYQTQVGGQAGLGLRFTTNWALNAGYTVMRQKYYEKSQNSESDVDTQLSGFNSNVNYTF